MATGKKPPILPKIDDYLSQVDGASTAEDVWALLTNFALEHKYSGICCKCFPSEAESDRRVFFSSTLNFNLDLAKLLSSAEPSDDPLLFCSLRSTRPFPWSELGERGAFTFADSHWDERLSKFGDAIVVPVFGPLIRTGYFCFVGAVEGVKRNKNEHVLHVLAQVAYLRMCELFFSSVETKNLLSPRECEVMRKVAKGRSNAEIADNIGVSVRTVETYLVRIFDKLGVRDRVRASLRAYALGLLV